MEGMKRLFLFALFLIGWCAAVQAQNLQVNGTVVSKADGFPVIGASVIEIGNDVSIGHNVTIHGAKICDGALVGMGAVVLDHVVVGEGAIVAAGAVVLSKTVIGPGELWGGTPAKFIKKVDPEQSKELNQKIAHNYLMYSRWYEEE